MGNANRRKPFPGGHCPPYLTPRSIYGTVNVTLPQPDLPTSEHRRLGDSAARRADWKNWGPYLAERAWGTVREDYSPDGRAWDVFPHDHARSRAYRWNEDGLAGFCNRFQNLCLALALWNGRDPFLKERLFGLANEEGNHGEDVKEYYYYLDGLPSHAYMRMLYKYPQVEYPYGRLLEENRRRSRVRAGVRAHRRPGRCLRGRALLRRRRRICQGRPGGHPLPDHGTQPRPRAGRAAHPAAGLVSQHLVVGLRDTTVRCSGGTKTRRSGPRTGTWASAGGTWTVDPHDPTLLFTENETNRWRLFGVPNVGQYVKDAFHEAVVAGRSTASIPAGQGSKAAGHYRAVIGPGDSVTVRTRLSQRPLEDPFGGFDAIVGERMTEADAFYRAIEPPGLDDDRRRVLRQAYAGMLWSKQFYHYSVDLWLDGDPAGPAAAGEPEAGAELRLAARL